MRRILIVGNWKMNLNASEASLLVHRLHERVKVHSNIEVVLAPSMLTLQPMSVQIDRRKFRLAAQNAYFVDEGAFTGEVSFAMLRDLVHYCIIGHSERRHKFAEGLPMVRDKVAAATRNDITPILCIGETKTERQDGEAKQVWHDQLMSGLSELTAAEVGRSVIAYEPVWAISNGSDYSGHEIPSPEIIKDAMAYIRNYVKEVFGPKAAENIRILYGGSVTDDITGGLLSIPGVDGLLVGGASLNYETFSGIIESTRRWQRNKGLENDA